jgi:hypothetical protein
VSTVERNARRRQFALDVLQEMFMANLLLIIGIILLVLWLLGIVTSTTLGGFVYVALVIGVILVIIWLVQRLRR